MSSKIMLLLLTLVLAFTGPAPVFAQENVPAEPGDKEATQAVYIPLVAAGQQTGVAAGPETPAEENLTDTMDAVEAAGHDNTGLVFVSTNAVDELRGNEVVMYRRSADGALTLSGRFPTGGQGLGGGLGSQGAVTLSRNGRWLFVVNAGSNEVSAFSVLPGGLILTDKVASGGVRPTSVTVRNNLVYVLNAGDTGNISGFRLDKDGKLAPLPDSTRFLSNNNSGASPAPAQVSFTPDGDALIVTERATNLIDSYKVHRNGLTTGPVVLSASGITPFGFAFARHSTLVVSEAFGGATDASAASSYSVRGDPLRLVSGSVPTGQTAACWVAVTHNGKYAYTTNAGSASLSLYQVDEQGRLTLLNSRAGLTGDGTGPTDVAISRDSHWLYALSRRSQNVIGFAVQENGSLVSLGGFGGLSTTPAGIAAW